MLTRESVSLTRLLGQPLLLIFYAPESRSAEEVLRFAQTVQDENRQAVTVVGLAVTEDASLVQAQQQSLRLSFPLLSGRTLRKPYGVDATPRFMVLDGTGLIRASFVGWGPETKRLIVEQMRRRLEVGGRCRQPLSLQPGLPADAARARRR